MEVGEEVAVGLAGVDDQAVAEAGHLALGQRPQAGERWARVDQSLRVDGIESLVEGEDDREDTYPRAVTFNRRLHQLLVETSGNPYLVELYRQLSARLQIVNFQAHRGFRRADLAQAEHRAILEAYGRRDPEMLAEVLTRHLERSRDTVLRGLANRAEPV